MRTLIQGGTIINEGVSQKADIIIQDDIIQDIIAEGTASNGGSFDAVIDARDACIIPGVIDSHVHFREPGLTHKADIGTESRAAAYGGVTTVFEMPNTKPQTTSLPSLQEKQEIARRKCHVNYAFFPGATNDNADFLRSLDIHKVPGIKLFMGSSTGNMLVDREKALDTVFAIGAEKGLPVMAHCEDTTTINHNMEYYKALQNTDDPDVRLHPLIRSEEACLLSTQLAVQMAQKHNARLHVAHVSTAKEVDFIGNLHDSNITAEATVAHLLFSVRDYDTLGSRIKCNPAIKLLIDREALRRALAAGASQPHITTIGTDHAPHTIEEKQGGAAKAMSGMPMIQFSLVAMLSLVDEGILTIEQMVSLMCHNPATLFEVSARGFIRKGYKADIAIIRRSDTPWQVTQQCVQSKCGWSPLEGMAFRWQVTHTIINGHTVYNNGAFDSSYIGESVDFR